MATEIAVLRLKTGVSLDPNSDAGSIWQDTVNTVMSQDGAQRCYWGQQVESPAILTFFVDWDSVDSHIKFTKDSSYGPFLKKLGTILDSSPNPYHVKFNPHPSPALANSTSPVTEVFTAQFPASISSSKQDEYVKNMEKLLEALKDAPGRTGTSAGWSEEVVNDSKLFVGVIGWTSIDAHNEMRATQAFKDNAHLLRTDDVKEWGLYHVSLTEIQGGFGAEERGGVPAQDVQEEVLNPQAGTKNPPKTGSQ